MPVKHDLNEEKLGCGWLFSPKSIRQLLDREKRSAEEYKKKHDWGSRVLKLDGKKKKKK